MKELEDTKCEVRRTIDLQFSIWDRLNASTEEECGSPLGSPGYNGSVNSLGNFFEDTNYAWLSYGPRLVVINVKTGTSISSWTFRERVTCVSQFPAQPGQIPLLLVGSDNGASKVRDSLGLVCVFDCATSQVLRAIRMPAGVEQACVVIGGAEWEDFGDKRIDSVLGENRGMACIALRNLDHLMIDLRRTSWEGPEATPLFDENNPAELDFAERSEKTSSRQRSSREKHAAYNLMNNRLESYIGFNREEFESSSFYQESLTSSLVCSRKIGCLVSGCLGRIIIWQTDGDVRWISAPLDDSMSITHLALLEPTDDPRPFCYLWSAYQEETCRSPAILRMYAMLFERKYTDKGSNSYLNLETDPSVKFELELDDNSRVTSLCPIARESNPEQTDTVYKRGEDSVLLISMDSRALLFDLNQWYKEQMPHTIGECNNPNAIIASYRTRPEIHDASDETILSCAYIPETLKEFSCNGSSPSEELFFPNSLSLDWIDLSTSRLTFRTTRGLQAELLREMSLCGPVIMIEPSETFHRCASAGLVSTSGEFSTNTDSKDSQRDTLLSLCLEQRWSTFLVKCAKEWSDGSASYLFHAFLRWGMQRASSIKIMADRLTVPLYDQSGSGIGETEVKQLRLYCQQLECISSIVGNLSIESVDLTKERRALHRVSTYLQVLIWFYDVGLLPESQEIDDDSTLPMSFSLKIPYPYERLATIYREKRQQFSQKSAKNSTEQEEDMFIDELVTRECCSLKSQWEREGDELSVGGYYPPSSLQSLLRSYLTDCHNNSDSNETENKHQITIYLLMDLAMLLPNSCPGVNQLIKYPAAFKLSPSLIKLTQALWLLDHEDYHGFLDMMTGQLVSDSDVKDWHHRLVLRTLIRNGQNKLALIYLRVRKPPLSSLEDQSNVISLSVEHGLVQSAFHSRPPSHYAQLLTSFFRACKSHDRLNDILHLALDHEEEEAFVKFLESENTEDTRLLYYLQRCRYAEASNVYPQGQPSGGRGGYPRNNEKPASLTIFNAYNATLPEITRKFSANIGRKVTETDPSSRYPRPLSHFKSRANSRDIHENVMRKARETFQRTDRSRIPFVSAPCCASPISHSDNVGTSTVVFADRPRKPRGKRSLDEMRDDDCRNVGDNEDDRKRRKIVASSFDQTDSPVIDRETGNAGNMVFVTPLVKRKIQITCATNTNVETPHSILKIRQLIRDSTSPCLTEKLASSMEIDEEKIHERERKHRQIRFSLGQQRYNDESTIRDTGPGSEEEVEKNIAESDVTDESEEIERNTVKDEISEEEQIDEVYYSPNVSEKSYHEPTLLSDASGVSINVSGPRPRPSLRRSNESSASSGLLKKSLKRANEAKNSRSPVSTESPRITSEISFALNETSRSRVTPSRISGGQNLLSETVYTSSILSSDTSFESTLPNKWTLPRYDERTSIRENTFSFSEQSLEKCRDTSALPVCTERSENLRRFGHAVMGRSSIRRSNVFEESTVADIEEDKNSDVLTEVDGFGLDRESSTQSPTKNTWDTDDHPDRSEIIGLSTIQSVTDISDMEVDNNSVQEQEREDKEKDKEVDQNENESLPDIPRQLQEARVPESEDRIRENEEAQDKGQDNEKAEDQENEDVEDETREIIGDSAKRETSLQRDLENREIVINQTEVAKSSDDYDYELLVLRYEDGNDDNNDGDEEEEEVYQSLSNSTDTVPARSESTSDKLYVPTDENDEAPKKSTNSSINNGFYEIPRISSQETNITDDESSRSVDGSAPSVDSARTRNDLEKTLSVQQMEPIEEDSNITNDDTESGSSFDSSLFSWKKPSRDLARARNSPIDEEKLTNEYDNSSSHDSSLFSKPQNLPSKLEKNLDAVKKGEVKMPDDSCSGSIGETLTSNTTGNDASEITNDSTTEEKERNELRNEESPPRAKRVRRLIEKIVTPKRSESPVVETESTTPLRRSRRASSVVQEQSPMMETRLARSNTTGRLRRSSSLAKDIFASTAVSSSTSTTGTKTDPKSSRLGRSISLAKESATLVKSQTVEESPTEETEEIPIGRRTRRATSVQKEAPVPTRTKITKSSSKVSLSGDNVEEPAPARKSTRAKKITSTSEDAETSIAPKRSTRSSSLAKEIPENTDDLPTTVTTRRTTRKRGSSMPKETNVERSTRASSLRSRRGSSVTKDVIPEEPSENVQETTRTTKKGRTTPSLRDKTIVEATKSSSPTPSTRSRLSSISSIPEEEHEEEESDSEIFSWRGKSSENKKITRQRRAASVDLPQVDVKRRTRAGSAKSAIIDDPIEEETSDIEKSSEHKTKLDKKAPVRRKRTASARSAREDEEEIVFEKLPQRRARKISQKSNDTETFSFSPPDKARERPDNDDEKVTGEVPDYVFSQPHTRTKHTIPQPRRKVNGDFIPLTEKERALGDRAIGFVSRPASKFSDRTREPYVLLGPLKVFSIPKRSKSVSSDSTGSSSQRDRKELQ